MFHLSWGCRFLCSYHWFAGAEHAAPHDGGPGAAHLITAGDHHHRQRAGLDQHRSRRSLRSAALRAAVARPLQALTSMLHSRPACRKSVTNVTRWSSSATPTRVWNRQSFVWADTGHSIITDGGQRTGVGCVWTCLLTSVDPFDFTLASLRDWKRHNGCVWWGDLPPIRGWFKGHVSDRAACLGSFLPCDKILPPSLLPACPRPGP